MRTTIDLEYDTLIAAKEIARAVCFLVDDEAGFITGETISVNGGQHME